MYCTICHEELSAEFYSRSGVQFLLGVRNCKHYKWVFVGDVFLTPPWDEETREIIGNAVANGVDASGGKYFLLPRSLANKYV